MWNSRVEIDVDSSLRFSSVISLKYVMLAEIKASYLLKYDSMQDSLGDLM